MKKWILATVIILNVTHQGVAKEKQQSQKAQMPIVQSKPAFSWSGFYIGGHIAPSLLTGDLTVNSTPAETMHLSKNAARYGLQAGYLYQFSNNIVLGAEVSYSLPKQQASASVGNQDIHIDYTINNTYTRQLTSKDLFVAGLRAGYAIGQWLPSAKVGYASSGTELSLSNISSSRTDKVTGITTPLTPLTVPSSVSGRSAGWAAGVGLDYAFDDNLTIGLDYTYAALKSSSNGIGLYVATSIAPTTAPARISTNLQIVALRLGYKF